MLENSMYLNRSHKGQVRLPNTIADRYPNLKNKLLQEDTLYSDQRSKVQSNTAAVTHVLDTDFNKIKIIDRKL